MAQFRILGHRRTSGEAVALLYESETSALLDERRESAVALEKDFRYVPAPVKPRGKGLFRNFKKIRVFVDGDAGRFLRSIGEWYRGGPDGAGRETTFELVVTNEEIWAEPCFALEKGIRAAYPNADVKRVPAADDGDADLQVRVEDFVRSITTSRSAKAFGHACGCNDPERLAVDLEGRVFLCGVDRTRVMGSTSDLSSISLESVTHWRERKKCPGCPVLQICKGSCMGLSASEWDERCARAIRRDLRVMGVGLEGLTSIRPASVENLSTGEKWMFGECL